MSVPIRILPKHMLSRKEWYDIYKDDIEDIVDYINDIINDQNIKNKNVIVTYDFDGFYTALLMHLYQTSYNTDKKWLH
jgi:hypothetical protein